MDELTAIVIGKDENASDIQNNWRGIQSTSNYCKKTTAKSVNFKQFRNKKYNHGVAGSKYCPGDLCCEIRSLSQFGYNANMPDKLDTYCVDCNIRKRREREQKRTLISMGFYSIDKYEQFKIQQEHGMWNKGFLNIIKPINKSPYVLKRDVIREIDSILLEARKKYKYVIPFTAIEVYNIIFTGKLICNVTGLPVTPACFMEHHSISVVRNKNVIDIKCNKCSLKP